MMDKSKLIKKKPRSPGKEAPEREPYEDIVTGHKFHVVNTGTIEGYPKEAFWCAFCGGKGKNFVRIKRDDGKDYLVGKTCLRNVGLVIPLSAEGDISLVKVQATKESGKPDTKKVCDSLQDDIEKLLRDL
jgi:hypothetical protein